ncbi:MAG: fatty acid desaturase [Planctomycetes bacterium]|nr:fatty acid desaturase [Planctomycetota bacterium]
MRAALVSVHWGLEHVRTREPRPDLLMWTGDLVAYGRAPTSARLREVLVACEGRLGVLPGNCDSRRLPQWFPGNIGFHLLHHLGPRIPDDNLERCHKSDPMFQQVRPMTLLGSLRSLGLRLRDGSSKKLVGYRHLRRARDQRNSGPEDEAREPERQGGS